MAIEHRLANVPFAIWQGPIHPPMVFSQQHQRLGGTGDIIERYGSHAPDSPVRVLNWAVNINDAHAAQAALYALKSTTVECVDAHGRTWPSVYVKDVRCMLKACRPGESKPGSGGAGVLVSHRIECDVVLVAQAGPNG